MLKGFSRRRKKVENNEKETVVVQRRAVRCARDLAKGEVLDEVNIEVLRPCPVDAIPASSLSSVVGKKVRFDMPKSEIIRWVDVE